MKVESLKKKFLGKGEVKGFEFTLINESKKAYMFKVDTGCSTYYEVFKKKSKTNSKCHCYPSSKAFGVWAWVCSNYENALIKFNKFN